MVSPRTHQRSSAVSEPHAPTGPVRTGPSRTPDYIERNRATWDRWALQYAARARAEWEDPQLRWGLWERPESELRILRTVTAVRDVVELGSGTGAVCYALARSGLRPVGVDFSAEQLKTAQRLQREFGTTFPLLHACVEAVPYDNESFELAISDYGASLWSDPRRWLPEARRLLRPDGRLVFFTNSALLMACTPEAGGFATDVLRRDYFAPYRVEFPRDDAVEFHPTHGHWVRLLRATGFELEHLLEIRPPRHAKPRFEFVSVEWARRWPSEEVWIARKVS